MEDTTINGSLLLKNMDGRPDNFNEYLIGPYDIRRKICFGFGVAVNMCRIRRSVGKSKNSACLELLLVCYDRLGTI
jgi:hypothetical protein